MPILMMALLALLVFGLIGILLSTAVILESSKRSHSVNSSAAHPVDPGAASLHPKL
jgi:hypothetical protein